MRHSRLYLSVSKPKATEESVANSELQILLRSQLSAVTTVQYVKCVIIFGPTVYHFVEPSFWNNTRSNASGQINSNQVKLILTRSN